MDDKTAIQAAVDALRPGLASDGFDLRLGDVDSDGAVEVVLEAKADACLDCLVPDEMLVSMLETSIRRSTPDAGPVTLTKKGFQG